MRFVDLLRQARTSRAAVLHEFWAQYDPKQQRVHVFFEAPDDAAFFRHFIDRYVPKGTRVYSYRCDGKARVFEAFTDITNRVPGIRSVLFFVDKDLDDIVGATWPTDPRIFVTDVYSIENYFVCRPVLESFYRDVVRLKNVQFDESKVWTHFEAQLRRFQCLAVVVMAWIVVIRRAGGRPNLNNVRLGELFEVTENCEIRKRKGARVASLFNASGIARTSIFRRVLPLSRELSRMPSKRVVRGKFEAWFLVEFWKKFLAQLQRVAHEGGGSTSVKIGLERSNVVSALAAHVSIPRPLELFLEAHFPQASLSSEPVTARVSWMDAVRRWFGLGRV